MPKTPKPLNTLCYCDSGLEFTQCCEKYLNGAEHPETAEQLMRSRYSANATANVDYLAQSWAPESRPVNLSCDPETKWIGLTIKRTEKGRLDDSEGIVEFVARYKVNGRAHRLHETSFFKKIQGRWYYVSGEIST